MKNYVFSVDGMMCGMCEAHVNDAVRKAANVKSVTSSHSAGRTEVVCDDGVDPLVIKAAIENEGYTVASYAEQPPKQNVFKRIFGKK